MVNKRINCEDCIQKCKNRDKCIYLVKDDSDHCAQNILDRLKKNLAPSPTRCMRSGKICRIITDDGLPTTYSYHRNMINDCLKEIRSGRTAYIYTELALKDILRYEPDIDLSFKDGIYYISL